MLRLDAGNDLLLLDADDGVVLDLARRLWSETDVTAPHPFEVVLRTSGSLPDADPEESLEWKVSGNDVRLAAPGLRLSVRPYEGRAEGTVARGLASVRPDLVVRLLLETPVTAMKMLRQQLLHAGAVVGSRGAVVIRGAAGAGKSTLVAACWASGLGLLGDESLLVRRDEPDRLEATLRDLTLTERSTELLGLESATVPALSGGERKRRVPLLATARPSDRLAPRAATVLLGRREPGPAHLVPLTADAFVKGFPEGEIPQERRYGGRPDVTAWAWAGRETYRLGGAADLTGAVHLVSKLAGLERPGDQI